MGPGYLSFLYRTLLTLAFVQGACCWAQRADSILTNLPTGLTPERRADTLNKIGFGLIFTDPTEARYLFNEAINISGSISYYKGHALALKNKAISYDIQGNSNQAIIHYHESLDLLELLEDTLGISRLKNNLGIAYKNLNDLETARKFYEESIALKKILGDQKGVAYGLNNVGEIYQKERNFALALEYFTDANRILDSLDDAHGKSITLSNLAVSQMEMGDYRLAITNLLHSMAIDQELEDYYSISYSYILLSKAYMSTNREAEALQSVEKAEQLAKEIGALKVLFDSQVVKAQILKKTNRLSQLPELYEQILILSDSLSQLNLTEETAKMKAVYESREKEREIENLKKEAELNQILIETKGRLFNLSLIAVGLLIVLLVVVFVLYRNGIAKKRELETKIVERDTAREEAQRANQAKSQFLAQMSHEIRTPLNAVIGYTDQIMETDLDDTQRKHMAIVNQSAMGLLGIINGILDLSKLEAGKLDLVIEHTDLIELCEHVVQMTSYKANRKNLSLKLVPVPDEHRFVMADDTRLRQVLVNLLANAVKFTESGEVELKVEYLNESPNGQIRFRFSVSDTGIGIRPENLEKIFHAFSQEDSSTTRRYGGTGLGLSISNILLSLMGSRLEVVSTPDVGSTFSFEIVLEKSRGGKARAYHGEAREKTQKILSEKPLVVLVAEDNATNMVLVKMMIKKSLPNAKILEAKNGIEVVEVYKAEKPDVVLMDIQMPEMDGYSASREIRAMETDRKIPIIAITAGSMQADKEKCYEAGMNDFISKPIVNDALVVTLGRWV